MNPRPENGLPPIIALGGPTASGKSALGMEICERIAAGETGWPGAEVLSVDSAQVYRGMDIGTAKPDAAARTRVPHHLLDILDPAETYSAAHFAADAVRLIAEIRARGRVPVLVGGTLLYFRALFEGLSELPGANAEYREQLEAEAAELGWGALHARLMRINPEAARRLHPNDAQRIQRALEIAHFSTAPPGTGPARPRPPEVPGPILRLAVMPPDRAVLGARIEARLRRMVAEGLVAEVEALRRRSGLHLGLPSMRAVGYRQLWRHLDGEYGLEEAIRLTAIATRQYAKRQMTWLRGEAEKWRWIDPTEPNVSRRVFSLIPESFQ